MSTPTDPALAGRRVTVGVGGGIAAYKAAALVSKLRQRGARVQVILTRAAARFVTPLTFEALSHRPALCDLFHDAPLEHVRLARETDLFVVAPATYDLIGKLAHGLADDYLTATLAATTQPVLLCPAMESQMYQSPILQENLRKLTALHYRALSPESGPLASGWEGPGRLPAPERILAEVEGFFQRGAPLVGLRVLVTAGPTRERLDPMRVLTNRSSGKMGTALAAAARERCAHVTLVSGPTQLNPPAGVEVVRVESAQEMFEAVTARAPQADWVIMAAAVADWRPQAASEHKGAKRGRDSLTLELVPTPDILEHLGQHRREGQVLVGFAAETQDLLARARAKLAAKNLDFIVANDVSHAAEADESAAVLLGKDGLQTAFPRMSKRALARELLDAVTRAR